jgi:putative heme-binding domain-containing protein
MTAGDPWVRHAAIAALGDEAAAALASLVADGSAHRQVIEGLARNVSVRDLEFIVRAASTAFPLDAAAVARGLSARHPVAAETLVRQILPQCRAVALSAGEAIADRAEATQTLALVPASQALPVLTELLHPRQPSSVQLAAVAALDAVNEDQVADALLSALAGAAPAVRTRILEAMLARPQRAAALLDAVETGRLSAGELPAEHRARLVAHPQRDIRERAGRLLAVNADRAAVVERYQREMRELTGDAARGRQVFLTACAVCHRVGDVGVELGPSLSAFVPRGAEALVLNVLDPNREVNPQFINYMVTTTDGRTLAGIIVAETAGSLTLTAGAGGAFTVARDQIVTMTSTGQSLMPIGLEAALSPQAMADLFAYITAPSDGD